MRNITLWLLLTLAFASCRNNPGKHSSGTAGSSPTGMQPESTLLNYYKHLSGNINGEPATMNLLREGAEYRGVYCYDGGTAPVYFRGHRNASGLIRLEELSADSGGAVFSGVFMTPLRFTGSRLKSGAEKSDTFSLEENYPAGTVQMTVHVLKDSVKLFPGEKNSQRGVVSYSLLWPGKGFPDSAAVVVRDTILRTFLMENKKVRGPQAALKIAADSFFVGYAAIKNAMNKKMIRNSPIFNWESYITMNVLWNERNFLSLEFDRYDFTGGAHGLENAFVKVFDLTHHRALSLDDVFKPGYDSTLRSELEKQLRLQYHIPENEPLNGGNNGVLFDRHITLTGNFYLTGKGIGFIYNPYEIAAYVYGRINLFIPYARLKRAMKADFRPE